MARNLYRFYLYIVLIALLIFAAFAIGQLLNTLLALTFLRGSYGSTPPSSADIVQAVVLAIVASAIAGILGGLHYWLIRRDMLHHPEAGASAIRSFFLNIPIALGVAVAVPVAGFVLDQLARNSGSSVVTSVAFVLPTLTLAGLLALERRRTQEGTGAALAFQRLHFYGVQILLLIFLTVFWSNTIRSLIDMLFFAGRGTSASCAGGGYCTNYNPFFMVMSALWFPAFWIGYGWFVRKDTSILLRLILHSLSFAFGIGYIIYGLYQAFEVLLLSLSGAAPALEEVIGLSATHDIISPLTLGILVAGVYFGWLRTAARQGLIEAKVLALTEVTILAILSAGAFWWGCGLVLYTVLQAWMPITSAPAKSDWIESIALVLAGIGYIPLSLYLRRKTLDAVLASGPRRGFVLALFGGGVLALAIGGAIALYAWITSVFGSPINAWQQVVHAGLAAATVGALLVAIYLSFALRERLFSGPASRVAPVQEVVAGDAMGDASVPSTTKDELTVVTVEEVLDELLAGNITRDEAANRIRAAV